MISPLTIKGNVQPMVLMSGLIATRTGYFIMSRHSGNPFARAVVTYCLFFSSSSVARRMRISDAVPALAMTTMGSQIFPNKSTNLSIDQGAPLYSMEKRPAIAPPRPGEYPIPDCQR